MNNSAFSRPLCDEGYVSLLITRLSVEPESEDELRSVYRPEISSGESKRNRSYEQCRKGCQDIITRSRCDSLRKSKEYARSILGVLNYGSEANYGKRANKGKGTSEITSDNHHHGTHGYAHEYQSYNKRLGVGETLMSLSVNSLILSCNGLL